MIIESISATPIVVPLRRAFHGSNYTVSERVTLLIRVITDDGVIGEAFVGDEREKFREIATLIEGPVGEAVLGVPLHRYERAWHSMFAITHRERDKGAALRAVSAVDVAIWDGIGKSVGRSISELLGGFHQRLPVVAFHYGPSEQPNEDLVADVDLLLAQGYAGIKLKVGRGDLSTDIGRVHALRERFGEDLVLGCDANRNWSPSDAIKFAHSVEGVGVDWLEEPVYWHSEIEGLRRVRDATSIPIAAGQSDATTEQSWRLMRAGSVDVLNSDAALIGGITAWKRLAAAATFDDIGLLHHEETHIACHLLTSVPQGRVIEVHADAVRDPVWHEMVVRGPTIASGKMTPPEGPGLGIEIDRDFVRRYSLGRA